ncbi:hypothetical protein A2U01_0060061, partial [Trifolium medium]|nr:hypothetical protein [Trifolium medium]
VVDISLSLSHSVLCSLSQHGGGEDERYGDGEAR